MPDWIQHTLDTIALIGTRLFWFSVIWVYLSALFNKSCQAYWKEKEEHYKRLEDVGLDKYKESLHGVN